MPLVDKLSVERRVGTCNGTTHVPEQARDDASLWGGPSRHRATNTQMGKSHACAYQDRGTGLIGWPMVAFRLRCSRTNGIKEKGADCRPRRGRMLGWQPSCKVTHPRPDTQRAKKGFGPRRHPCLCVAGTLVSVGHAVRACLPARSTGPTQCCHREDRERNEVDDIEAASGLARPRGGISPNSAGLLRPTCRGSQ